jgi:uncharacterized protein YjbI with pentapeptide repeats
MHGTNAKNSFFEQVSAKEDTWRLIGVDLSGSTLMKCNTKNLTAFKCTFNNIFFDQTNLWQSKFLFCSFTQLIAVHTGLNESKFRDCLIISCDFNACRLRTTNFERSFFEGSKIAYCLLESADFSESIILGMEMVDNYCGSEDQFPTLF